jgi:hypothetical protein
VSVRGPDGAPVAGAYASVVRVGGVPVETDAASRSDAQGQVELPAPAGAIEVEAGSGGSGPVRLHGTVAATVPEGGVVSAELVLAPKAPPPRR